MSGLAEWYRTLRAPESAPHPGRNSLAAYARHMDTGYRTPAHILELAALLESVERRERDRVIITIPVRHGKSLLSQMFIGWFMARNPTSQIIHASHTASLVQDFGANVRNAILDPRHQDIFPGSSLAPDARAAKRWRTPEGGVYVAAGAGGAIAGRGADLLVVDDATAGREAADSEVQSRKVWTWWQGDVRSRLLPGAAIVIIGSRWSEHDLIGRILEHRPDRWHVHHRPAISDSGEALWPEQYSAAELADIRADTSPREWQAQYMGSPAPDTGLVFDVKWFRRGTEPPLHDMRCYGASDYAVSEGKGDYTVHMVVGVDRQNRLWVIDLWRGRKSPDKWIGPMVAMMNRYQPIAWLEEAGPIAKAVDPYISAELLARKAYCRRVQMPSVADKRARARSIEGRMAMHGLYIGPDKPWESQLIAEMLSFDAGAHDDVVDCLSLIGRLGSDLRGPTDTPAERIPEGHISFDQLRRGTGYGVSGQPAPY